MFKNVFYKLSTFCRLVQPNLLVTNVYWNAHRSRTIFRIWKICEISTFSPMEYAGYKNFKARLPIGPHFWKKSKLQKFWKTLLTGQICLIFPFTYKAFHCISKFSVLKRSELASWNFLKASPHEWFFSQIKQFHLSSGKNCSK